MDWGAKKSPSEQMGEPSICELIRRVRELLAEGTTTVDLQVTLQPMGLLREPS